MSSSLPEALSGPYRQCSNGITWRPKSSVPATKSSKMHMTPLRPSIEASSSSCLATVVWLPTTLPILRAKAFCIWVMIAVVLPDTSRWPGQKMVSGTQLCTKPHAAAPVQPALHRTTPCCRSLQRGSRGALGGTPEPGVRRGRWWGRWGGRCRSGGAKRPFAFPIRIFGLASCMCRMLKDWWGL
jgi:hypothetical protein